MAAAPKPRVRASGHVDVLLVRTGTTPGLRQAEVEFVRALNGLGLRVATVSTGFGLLGRLRVAFPLIDLIEGLSLRRLAVRALRRTDARAVFFSSAGAITMQPASVLRRSAVRFDSTIERNRPGRRNAFTRLLARRAFRHAAVLLPVTPEQVTDFSGDPRVHVLPRPVAPGPEAAGRRERAALCYAGNPDKKGLDIAVAAWTAAAPNFPLYVTGIDAEAGRDFLRRRGVSNTANVVWLGHLDPDTHRALSARVEIYLSAARREEYGGVQREALVDGAVLVCAPSAGPEQLLAIARSLDPELVAGDFDARTLAACLTRALSMSEQDRLSYRARAMELMSPNTRANLERILADDVLGVLEVRTARARGGRGQAPPVEHPARYVDEAPRRAA